MYENIFLETPRLVIKTTDMKDFCALRMLQKDDHVMEFFDAPRSEFRITANIHKIYNHLLKYDFAQGPVFHKETREFIGRAGLTHLDFKDTPDVELGYFLLEEYWNQGYGTELADALIKFAFNKLDSIKVYATIDPKNIASIKVSEKIGMLLEKEDTYETHNKQVRFYVKHRE